MIFWELPPSEFVKINFDGSIRDGRDGAGYVIRGLDVMLAARSSHLFDPFVLRVKLRAAWATIICARHEL